MSVMRRTGRIGSALFFCADDWQVQVGTTPPLQSLVTGWMTLAPMRQVNIEPKELADIESRMPAGHIDRDSDLVTWAHETTHGINSRCRVWAGSGMNAFYCLSGGGGGPGIRSFRT